MDFNKKNSVCSNYYCKFNSKKLKECVGSYAGIEKGYIQTGRDCPRDVESSKVVKFKDVEEDHIFYYQTLRLQKENDSEGVSKGGSRLQFVPNTLVTIYK